MSIKNFLIKKMLASKMKGVPEAELDKLIVMIEKNPELFKKIAEEIDFEMKQGKDQMTATMGVMQKYEEELRKLI